MMGKYHNNKSVNCEAPYDDHKCNQSNKCYTEMREDKQPKSQ